MPCVIFVSRSSLTLLRLGRSVAAAGECSPDHQEARNAVPDIYCKGAQNSVIAIVVVLLTPYAQNAPEPLFNDLTQALITLLKVGQKKTVKIRHPISALSSSF